VTQARLARPHDVLAVGGLLAGGKRNEAVGWLSPPGSSSAGQLLQRWGSSQLPWHRGSALVLVSAGTRVRAAAGGTRRAGKAAWQVDQLFAPEAAASADALDALAGVAAAQGAHRIFLRLPVESRVLEPARTAGFMPYTTECLMLAETCPAERSAQDLRLVGRADLQPLFQLYNRVVPQNVRALEAVTLEEWVATRNPIGAHDPVQFVAADGDELTAWVRTAQSGPSATFDALVDTSNPDRVSTVATAVCALLAGGNGLRAFVPSYLESFAYELERRGFERGAEFILLARQLAKPVAELKPARVAEEAAWIS
jgi:hypothetical protein